MPLFKLDSALSIPDLGTKEYEISQENRTIQLFVVHQNGAYYAYLNHCPHTGVNLNWQADQFFDIENKFLQCSTHGALFRVEDGLCIRGPCAGASLQSVPLEINNDSIYVKLED